jgi:hypothetical protein
VTKVLEAFFNLTLSVSLPGSHSTCAHNLQTFGIPANLFPIKEDGEFTNDENKEKWEKRRKLERMVHKVDRVGVPGRNDVLLGRGKGPYQYIGNITYRSLMERHFDTYNDSSNEDKKRITKDIVDTIKESSGRFLKDDGAGWEVVADDVARLKVSHAFRTYYRDVRRSASSRVESEATLKKRDATIDCGASTAKRVRLD